MILGIIKTSVGIVGGWGTGIVVGNIIQATTPEIVTKVGKVGIKVGSFAIGGLVAMHAKKYTDELIDEVNEVVDNVKVMTKKAV